MYTSKHDIVLCFITLNESRVVAKFNYWNYSEYMSSTDAVYAGFNVVECTGTLGS